MTTTRKPFKFEQRAQAHSPAKVTAQYNGPYVTEGAGRAMTMYDAVQYSTNRSVRPFFATDSQHTLNTWSRLRALALARWAYINVPFVRGAVDLMARLTVGTGFTCESASRNKKWAAASDEYVAAKFANIGFANGESMNELLLHDCRCADVDGDLGYVMALDDTGTERLQLIEAHRIRKGENDADEHLIDGVWVDQFQRRTAYNVVLPGDVERTKKIGVRDFIYLSERNRPDELRSMTNLIHALNPLQDLYEVLAFEMQSVKKNSEIGLTIETPTPENPPLGPGFDVFQTNGAPAQLNADGSVAQPAVPKMITTYEQVFGSGGKIPILRPGERLAAHNHTRPAPGMKEWSEFTIRGIAVGYGVPFEVMWNPETIGGANTRLITALLRARLEQRRAAIIFPKLRRVRYWLLARAVQAGELPYDPDLAKVNFRPNFSDITVDAGREASQRRANVLTGLDTFTGFYAQNGQDYITTQLPVRETEMDAQCAAAERLCQKYPNLPFPAALARIATLTQSANEGNLSTPDHAPEPAKRSA